MGRQRRVRRLWTDDEIRRIVAQTLVPGVSVSQVARRYDVNANLVFKWLRDPRFKPSQDNTAVASFLPVAVMAECAPPSEAKIEITLVNGHQVSINGAFVPDTVCRLVRGLT